MGFFENAFGAPQETPGVDQREPSTTRLGLDSVVGSAGSYTVDSSTGYADGKQLTLGFLHVPTGVNVYFKAFLTGYSDSFTSNWNEEEVYGRNDPIMTFRGTRRRISLSWSVPAHSYDDGHYNLEKCSVLMKMLYPVYSDNEGASSITKSPLFRLKFLNLIGKGEATATLQESGLLGAMRGFTFEPELDAGLFDMNPNGAIGSIAPKVLNLNCDFTVLHEEDLGWTPWGSWRGSSTFPYGEQLMIAADAELTEMLESLNEVPGEGDVDAEAEAEQALFLSGFSAMEGE